MTTELRALEGALVELLQGLGAIARAIARAMEEGINPRLPPPPPPPAAKGQDMKSRLRVKISPE